MTDAPATVTIQGLVFALPPQPYAEGHVLTALEAGALNQTWAENLRNNFASQVKKIIGETPRELSENEISALTAKFTEYAASYQFSVRATRTPTDPVGAEAYKLAKAAVMAALKSKLIDTKTLPEGKMDELVKSLLAKKSEFTEEAQRRVVAAKAAASDVLSQLGID